ncbi:MAG: hypothetical protein WCL50_15945, partial [Spirochaetota bacterium]
NKSASDGPFIIAQNAVLAATPIGTASLTGWTALDFWMKSVYGTSFGDLQFVFDNDATCATPSVAVNLPAAAANTWMHFVIPLPPEAEGSAGLAYLGVRSVPFLNPNTFRFDGITVRRGVFDPQSDTLGGASGVYSDVALRLKALTTPDSKALVLWRDNDLAGHYKVIVPTTGAVTQEVIFSGPDVTSLAAAYLDDGNLAVAYSELVNENGYFKLYSPTGANLRSKVLFETDRAAMPWVLPLANRDFLLLYKAEKTQDNKGWISRGGDYSLYLEKVDTGTVRFQNFSGDSQFLTLSVNR